MDVVATERVVDGCVEDVLTERAEREESEEVGSGGILDGSCDGGGAMCGGTGAAGIAGEKRVRRSGFT